jgi:hypothetical protein
MKKEWICSICGQSTFDVDMDYLMGTDHISCILKLQTPKIHNWNKLEGQRFEVMGVSLYLKDASSAISQSDIYTVWIYEEPNKVVEPLIRINLFLDTMEIDMKTFPSQGSSTPFHTNKKITKDHIKNPSIFIQTIGQMMMGDRMIRSLLDLLSEIRAVNKARGGMSGGIVNTVLNAGTTVTYSKSGVNGSSAQFAQTFGSASLW